LIGAPAAGLRREGELEPAPLPRLDGGIGAVPTQLEVVRIGARKGYLADLQRGLAIIPQTDSERFAFIARCNAPEVVARWIDCELRGANRPDRSSGDLYPVWTLGRVAFNQQRGTMGAHCCGREDYPDAAVLPGGYAPIHATVSGYAEERGAKQPDAGDLQRRVADTCDRDRSFINPASNIQIAEFQLGRRHTGARRRRLDAEPIERHVHSLSGRIVSDDQRRPALSAGPWSVDNSDRTLIAL
jgi:hypothetical protein